MRRTSFDDNYKIWIWQNISRGCDRADVFRALYQRGFDYAAIKLELSYEPPEGEEGIKLAEFQLLPVDSPAPSLRQEQRIHFPLAQRMDSPHLEIYTIDDFLTEEECDRLVQLTEGRLKPATTTSGEADYRTNRTCAIDRVDDPVVDETERRVCGLFGLYPRHPERAQIQFYRPGEFFKDHKDAFEPGTRSYITHAAAMGQRVWTFMIYLNDVTHGGATVFPRANLILCPKRGRAVFWNNLDANGDLNPNALHRALPVDSGYKVIFNKWIRESRFGDADTANRGRHIRNYTVEGMRKERIPAEIFETLSSFYLSHTDKQVDEYIDCDYLTGAPGVHPSVLIELPVDLKRRVSSDLQPLLEEWSGQKLESTAVYGLRRYHRGASLRMHVDRTQTHIISATLNIDQKVDEDWPFEIVDHRLRHHELILEPAEMVFYEGARMMHGRPRQFVGDAYCNLFVHYRPV